MEVSYDELSKLCINEWLHRKLGFVSTNYRKNNLVFDVINDILWEQGIQSTDEIYEDLFTKLENDLNQAIFKMTYAEGIRKEYLDAYLKIIMNKCINIEFI